MLNQEQINENKERYIALLNKADRKGQELLVKWLSDTDFFTAPSSTRFHEAYKGGLCEHSLIVYDKAMLLNTALNVNISEDKIIICTLLHDLCKINFYKESFRNAKNEKTGAWEKVATYVVEDAFPYGHGEKSVFLAERFLRLSTEEAMAIRWHMGAFDESVKGGSYALSKAFELYPIATLIHMADLASVNLK